MTAMERGEKLAELESIHERSVKRAVAVERLAELLKDSDEAVRAQASGAAERFPGEEELTGELLELARGDESGAVREAATGALGAVIREGVLFGAEGEGYAPDGTLSQPSAERFKAVKELLLELLAGDDRALRRRALEGLGYLGREPAVVAAIEELADAGSEADRLCWLTAMGRSGDPRWASAIQEAVEEGKGGKLGERAIWAAGACEVTDVAGLIGRFLRSSSQETSIRVAAAAALAGLGRDQAPTLLEVAESAGEEDEVRGAARRALEVIDLSREGGAS